MMKLFLVLAAFPALLGEAVWSPTTMMMDDGLCADAGGVCGFEKCNPNCAAICESLMIPFHGKNSQCGVTGNSPHDGNNGVSGAEDYCDAEVAGETCCKCRDYGPLEDDETTESYDFEQDTCDLANGVCGFDKCSPNCEAVCEGLGVPYLHNSQCGVTGNSENRRNNYVAGAEDYCDALESGDTCCQCVELPAGCFDEPENLGFESGDLSGWDFSVLGPDPQVICGDGEAQEENCYAKISTQGTSPDTGLNTIGRQDLYVGCEHDTRLSFYYRFDTFENNNFAEFNDFMRIEVINQETGNVEFTDTLDVDIVGGNGSSGWLHYEEDFELENTEVVTINFSVGITNVGDDIIQSFGFIDGIEIH